MIEYVGEVFHCTDNQYIARDRESIDDTYLFELEDGLVIDARYKGNLSRFINHSHDPNLVQMGKSYKKIHLN